MTSAAGILEISDLIADWDPVTGQRREVRRSAVLERLAAAGDDRGARMGWAVTLSRWRACYGTRGSFQITCGQPSA
jgi:hypothetical protein